MEKEIMIDVTIIGQEKTNEELGVYTDKIVDLITDLNLAEKYKLVSCLLGAIESEVVKRGGTIIERERDDGRLHKKKS